MSMKKFHLLNDFGIYKTTIRKNFFDNDRPAEYDDVFVLLSRRGSHYTLAEIKRLFGFLWTAHDECVLANTDDFNPLQIYAAEEKIKRGEEALKKLKELEDMS